MSTKAKPTLRQRALRLASSGMCANADEIELLIKVPLDEYLKAELNHLCRAGRPERLRYESGAIRAPEQG